MKCCFLLNKYIRAGKQSAPQISDRSSKTFFYSYANKARNVIYTITYSYANKARKVIYAIAKYFTKIG